MLQYRKGRRGTRWTSSLLGDTMSWREYFTVEVPTLIEKMNPYHDELGRFTSGDGAASGKDRGESSRNQSGKPQSGAKPQASTKGGPRRSNLMNIKEEFSKLPQGTQFQVIRNAIESQKIQVGKDKSLNMSRLMYTVSQLTGQHPDKELAEGVTKTLARMNKAGLLNVKHEEVPLVDKNGTVVLRKLEDRVFTGDPKKDYEANVVTRTQLAVSLSSRGQAGAKSFDIQHTGEITRPAKYDIDPESAAGKFLLQRREEYADTRVAVMGRYFSSNKNAPEMTHSYDKEKVERLSAARTAAKENFDKVAAKYPKDSKEYKEARKDFNTADHKYTVGQSLHDTRGIRDVIHKDKEFYDATSSVNGIIGTMTGNQSMLMNSRLAPGYDKEYPHSATLAKVAGIKDGAFKPYFANTLTGAAGTLQPDDFKGLGTKGAASAKDVLKDASKALFTPGTYGSNVHGATYESKISGLTQLASGGAKNAAKLLEESGMKHDLAVKTASKMAENFKSSPLVQFNQSFRELVSEAPEGFVYKNPMSGFDMTFDKYSRNKLEEVVTDRGPRTRIAKDKDGNPIQLSKSIRLTTTEGKTVDARVPYVQQLRDSGKTGSGAAALFIQNWDAAIITELGREMKSAHTLHDAIGIKKGQATKLHEQVAKAYNKVAKADPIGDLGRQIAKHVQREFERQHPKPTPAQKRSIERKLQSIRNSVLKIRNSTRNPGQPAFTSHDQNNLANVNVKPDNAHFEKE